MDLGLFTSRHSFTSLAHRFRDFSPPLVVRNDTLGNDLFQSVISIAARNPYGVSPASSISETECSPLMSLRAKRSNLLVS